MGKTKGVIGKISSHSFDTSFKCWTSQQLLCIYRALWILLLSDSILPSLCTASICVQRICVFVCPLIPNLNICPTSPYNIGPVARPCPLETAINSVLFLPILVLVHWPMTNKRKSKVCENMGGAGGKHFCSFQTNLPATPLSLAWEPKMLKYRCSKLISNMGPCRGLLPFICTFHTNLSLSYPRCSNTDVQNLYLAQLQIPYKCPGFFGWFSMLNCDKKLGGCVCVHKAGVDLNFISLLFHIDRKWSRTASSWRKNIKLSKFKISAE